MTANQSNVLYLVNLIDAEIRLESTGSDKWEDADLSAILADYNPFGNRNVETFGKKLERASESGVGAYVDSQIHIETLNKYRCSIVHNSKYASEPYQELAEVARVATRVAKATTGRNFDYVERFSDLDDLILEVVGIMTGTCPRELGAAVVAYAHNGDLNASDVRWLWRYVNLRNRHVHTGYALKADERRFVESIVARLRKLAETSMETKAGRARMSARFARALAPSYSLERPSYSSMSEKEYREEREAWIESKKREFGVDTAEAAMAAHVEDDLAKTRQYFREFVESKLN